MTPTLTNRKKIQNLTSNNSTLDAFVRIFCILISLSCGPIFFNLVIVELWYAAFFFLSLSFVFILIAEKFKRFRLQFWLIRNQNNYFAPYIKKLLLTNLNKNILEEEPSPFANEEQIKNSAYKLYKSFNSKNEAKTLASNISGGHAFMMFCGLFFLNEENNRLITDLTPENVDLFLQICIYLGVLCFCVIYYFLYKKAAESLINITSLSTKKKVQKYKELNPKDPRNKYL